jgi:hypothetical protein
MKLIPTGFWFRDGYDFFGEKWVTIVDEPSQWRKHTSEQHFVRLDRWHKFLRKMRGYWLCRNGHGEIVREGAKTYRCKRCNRET